MQQATNDEFRLCAALPDASHPLATLLPRQRIHL
jgi:hypothetical protein